MKTQISVVKTGGAFDNGAQNPIRAKVLQGVGYSCYASVPF
jgi:hypothetical protein